MFETNTEKGSEMYDEELLTVRDIELMLMLTVVVIAMLGLTALLLS